MEFETLETTASKVVEQLHPDIVEFLRTPHYTIGGTFTVSNKTYYYKLSGDPKLIDNEPEVVE